MFTFSFNLTDSSGPAKLARLEAGLRDLSPVLDDLGLALVATTLLHFRDGKDPDGQRWKPSRRATQEGGQTLLDSGLLRDSFTYQVAGNSVEVGTNVIYAAIHNFGGQIRPKTAKALRFTLPGGAVVTTKSVVMPKRTFSGWGDDEKSAVANTVTQWLEEIAA